MIRKYLQKIYLALIFILLYAPIVTLVVLSFNQSKTRAKWGGFTLKWYKELFQNEQIMSAFYTTLIIAFVSAAIATIIGTAAAIAIQGMKQKWKTMYMGLTNIPMMNAEIVMGVSLMLLFIAFHMTLGFGTILIAHITFNIPYVILSVSPKLKQTNRYTYEAAMDLGASPVKAFFKVVFPDIVPGVLSGFMLAFTMSLDDFVITTYQGTWDRHTFHQDLYRGTKGNQTGDLCTFHDHVRDGACPSDPGQLFSEGRRGDHSQKESPQTIQSQEDHHRRVIPVTICILFIGGGFYYAEESGVVNDDKLVVYNWGEYIDPEVLTIFEEETGINVVYEEFETNEILYPKVSSGAIAYDVVCPSDYMIQRMIENDLLTEINLTTFRISRISASSIWNSPDSLTRRINIPYHTAGELSVSFTTRLWWMSRSTAGRSSGIQNTRTTF